MGNTFERIRKKNETQKEIKKILDQEQGQKNRDKALKQMENTQDGRYDNTQISYYLSQTKERLLSRIIMILGILLILVYGIFLSYRFYIYKNPDKRIKVDESTLSKANEYYNNSDYEKAQSMYEKLVQATWDDYRIYENLANIYLKDKNYDAAADVLLTYLNFDTTSINGRLNKAYQMLLTIPTENQDLLEQISYMKESADKKGEIFDSLYNLIREKDYDRALYQCEISSYANDHDFDYYSAYIYTLCESGRTEEAYKVFKDYIQPTDETLTPCLSTIQFEALMNYATGIDEKYYDEVCDLTYELEEKGYVKDTNTTSDRIITPDDARSIIKETLIEFGYWRTGDELYIVPEETTLFAGQVCYCVDVMHNITEDSENKYFYVGMDGNIYYWNVSADGKAIPITSSQSLDQDENIFQTCKAKDYAKVDNSTLLISFSDDGTTVSIFDKKDKKYYLQNEKLELSDHGIFAKYKNDSMGISIVANQDKVIVLLSDDIYGKYLNIEGVYEILKNK